MMRTAVDAASRLHTATGNPDHQIGVVLADAGYNSEANLTLEGPDRLIAPGRAGTRRRPLRRTLPRVHRHRARLHGKPTLTGYAPPKAEISTNVADSRPQPANCTWQPPHSTS